MRKKPFQPRFGRGMKPPATKTEQTVMPRSTIDACLPHGGDNGRGGQDGRDPMDGPGVEVLHAQFLPDGRANTRNAAIYLGTGAKTMTDWRAKGIGPRFRKVRGKIFYFKTDLDRFIRGE
jgi:hypothetical protein